MRVCQVFSAFAWTDGWTLGLNEWFVRLVKSKTSAGITYRSAAPFVNHRSGTTLVGLTRGARLVDSAVFSCDSWNRPVRVVAKTRASDGEGKSFSGLYATRPILHSLPPGGLEDVRGECR